MPTQSKNNKKKLGIASMGARVCFQGEAAHQDGHMVYERSKHRWKMQPLNFLELGVKPLRCY